MTRNSQQPDPEDSKGDLTYEDDELDLRDTIPEPARVTREEQAVDDDDVLDEEPLEIDLDELPESEGPDA